MKNKQEKVRDWLDKGEADSFFTHVGCPECGKHYEAIRKHEARNHGR